jgi:hypothetical protein
MFQLCQGKYIMYQKNLVITKNYSLIPNQILDGFHCGLFNKTEYLLMLFFYRMLYNWKESFRISYKIIMLYIPVIKNRNALSKAIQSLIDKGLINVRKHNKASNEYHLTQYNYDRLEIEYMRVKGKFNKQMEETNMKAFNQYKTLAPLLKYMVDEVNQSNNDLKDIFQNTNKKNVMEKQASYVNEENPNTPAPFDDDNGIAELFNAF